jgi:hypothetical protein
LQRDRCVNHRQPEDKCRGHSIRKVGFVGARLDLDPAYVEKRSACLSALVAKYNVNYSRLDDVPGPGDPIDQNVLVELPAYARLEQYRQASQAVQVARMARKLLPADQSRAFAASLEKDVPALFIVTAGRSAQGGTDVTESKGKD